MKRIEPVEPGARLRLALKIGATVLLTVVIFSVLMFAVYRERTSPSGAHRREYEGLIVDKFETFVETQQGSGVSRRLLIQDKNGTRFEVAADEELYQRAQKGMWIKKSFGQRAELSWP